MDLDEIIEAWARLGVRLDAANRIFDSGRPLDGWLASLRAFSIFVNSDPGWQNCRRARSIEILGQEIYDLKAGHRSAVLQAPPGRGRPTTTAQKNIALYAPAFAEAHRRRSRCEIKSAADAVAKWFAKAGINIPAARILEWRRRHKRSARFRDIVTMLVAAPEEVPALIRAFAQHHLIAGRGR